MDNIDTKIYMLVDQFDQETKKYDAVWGIGNLPRIVTAELASKWETQMDLLSKAIQERNLRDLQIHVSAALRGYQAMEDEAKRLGRVPDEPDAWEVVHPETGTKYLICKNSREANKAHKDGYHTYTLTEVARLLENNQLINKTKELFPGAEVTETKDWVEDTLPF